jgi:hypothetical protein
LVYRRELAAGRGALELPAQQLVAVGNHVRTGNRAKFLGSDNPDVAHEVADVDLVDPARPKALDVGEPS